MASNILHEASDGERKKKKMATTRMILLVLINEAVSKLKTMIKSAKNQNLFLGSDLKAT